MNRNKLKTYAPAARREFIQAVKDRAVMYGLSAKKIETMTERGEVVLIAGQPFPKAVASKRKRLEEKIAAMGFERAMEAIAYSWFNRFVAIRFMELHGYLDHGYRVLSHPSGDVQPEILEHAQRIDFPGLDKNKVVALKLDGTKQEKLYRLLLVAQCNALSQAMPFLFERIDDETELLLPSHLLATDSLIQKLVQEIDEEDWKEVEIIGWLYQFYISERKDEVIGKAVASEDIPAATQLFTPNWIVKYLVQNTLGRIWLATYPQSGIRQHMEFYIEPAEQTPEVQEQLRAITPTSLNPEELTLLDPACGSAHILVEAYELFKAIYQERGYRAKDIPGLILSKNLYGLEIDDRAAQLAAFALLMKARADDRRILESGVQPNILSFVESKGMDAGAITHALNSPIKDEKTPASEFLPKELEEAEMPLLAKKGPSAGQSQVAKADITALLDLFEEAKTFGSLIQIPAGFAEKLAAIEERLAAVLKDGDLTHAQAGVIAPLLRQAKLLARQYDVVVANPPYMGRRAMNARLKEYGKASYDSTKNDLCTMFIARGYGFNTRTGMSGCVAMHSWMFLPSFEEMRTSFLSCKTLYTCAHCGPGAFDSISGEVVQVAAFASGNVFIKGFRPTLFRLVEGDAEAKEATLKRRDGLFCDASADDFSIVPGSPLAYWMSAKVRAAFVKPALADMLEAEGQNKTADNDRFLRLFWEVPHQRIGRDRRWLLYAKGGPLRRWWGNIVHVVDWSSAARTHYRRDSRCRLVEDRYLYRKGITWTDITASSEGTSFRILPEDTTFDMSGPSVFVKDDTHFKCVLGLLNSKFTQMLLPILNPTLHVQLANVRSIPWPEAIQAATISRAVERCVAIAKADWDACEVSYDFRSPAVVAQSHSSLRVSRQYVEREAMQRRYDMKTQEEAINRLVIEAYDLQDELTPEVLDDQITLYRPDREEDIKRLLSYAVGCMMGRYGLDTEGLIYAHSGNEGFDPCQYARFPADDDGIIPVTETHWFDDDAASRFERFVRTVWPSETLEENLAFVAESLGEKRSETPRETIRRYLAGDFYKHHLQTYMNRPIYWLFSSGKQGAFEALVYLHRYNEGTLSRMRTEYVVPLMGKMNGRLGMLADTIAKATSSRQRKDAEKEKDRLTKQLAELQAFDEKLRHYADQRITLDLDDGVKVNYSKFGDLLADVKKVCGRAEEE
jgi:hypothetical protein